MSAAAGANKRARADESDGADAASGGPVKKLHTDQKSDAAVKSELKSVQKQLLSSESAFALWYVVVYAVVYVVSLTHFPPRFTWCDYTETGRICIAA